MKIPPETIVTIRFASPENGGTEHLPEEYVSANVRLRGGDETWSMLIEFLDQPDYEQWVLAKVDFLAEEAPSERLVKGMTFDLIEVGAVVATAKVVVDCVAAENDRDEQPIFDGDRVGPVRHRLELGG